MMLPEDVERMEVDLYQDELLDLENLHQRHENTTNLPYIRNMNISEYVMNIKIIKRTCFVSNKVVFCPRPDANEQVIFIYRENVTFA